MEAGHAEYRGEVLHLPVVKKYLSSHTVPGTRGEVQNAIVRSLNTHINPGGGVLNKVLYREAPPRGPTPYFFIYHFGRKGTSFIYLLLRKVLLSLTYFRTLHLLSKPL